MTGPDFDGWVDDALGLFDVDEANAPKPPAPAEQWGAVGVKWTLHKGAHRACDDCTALIHELGVGRAPHPASARHRRKGPNGDLFVCNEHAEQRKRKDAEAERVRAERLAHSDHEAKAARSR
jgi:hypothetical protein